MSIIVVCPNGHKLKAQEKKAGKIGHCPACGAEVVIPPLEEKKTSESSILRILGVGQELRERLNDENDPHEEAKDLDPSDVLNGIGLVEKKKLPTKKICPQCDWEIDAGFKICPHCRYYFMS